MKINIYELIRNAFSFGTAITTDIHTSLDDSAAECYADAFIHKYKGYNVVKESAKQRRIKTEFVILEAVNAGVSYAKDRNDIKNLETMIVSHATKAANSANSVFNEDLDIGQYCVAAVDFYNGVVAAWTSISE